MPKKSEKKTLEAIRNDCRRIMKEKNIGLRGLEELVGVSFSTLSRILRGADPDYKTLLKLEAFSNGKRLKDIEPISIKRFSVGGKSFIVEIREVSNGT